MNNIIKNETDAYILWAALKCSIDGYETPLVKVMNSSALFKRCCELMDELEYNMKVPFERFE